MPYVERSLCRLYTITYATHFRDKFKTCKQKRKFVKDMQLLLNKKKSFEYTPSQKKKVPKNFHWNQDSPASANALRFFDIRMHRLAVNQKLPRCNDANRKRVMRTYTRARNFECISSERASAEVHANVKIIAATAELGWWIKRQFVMPGDPSKLPERLIPV